MADMATAERTTPVDRIKDFEIGIDMVALRGYRLGRVRDQLRSRGLGACLLLDPTNIRYASGFRMGPIFQMHVPLRYLFVATDGPAILFGVKACELETIDEVRPGRYIAYFFAGPRIDTSVGIWADEIADLVREHCGGDPRLAIDRGDARTFNALNDRGIALCDAQEPVEFARVIKSAEEILCMNFALATAEIGFARMHEQLRPGMTENELWSILWQTNMAMGGEWIEGRLLASGDRTNPWFQEAGDRVIRPGELVAFDTDMIGPFGYCADISRTFRAGPGAPTDEQRDLYKTSYEQLNHNIELLQPGMSFRELSERAWPQPDIYAANRYVVLAHGVGLCDEYPAIYYQQDWEAEGYDGTIEPNMVLCVESYIGAEGGRQGVKLEEQVLITETGYEVLSHFPFEPELLV
ncbi:MAG: Xaa-Pro peptidase family protein [Proteobacteria bacterium]|nr:Xaa-Pro peptidase family protein [Pseudomonadota bacterium]